MKIVYHEGSIREYDIRAANISCLAEKELISEELFYDLLEGVKSARNIIVGKLNWSYPEVARLIIDDIATYVDMFIESNNLQPNNILEIAKDAIFTNDIKSTYARKLRLDFGKFIKFIPKNNYVSCFEFTAKKHSESMIKLYLGFEGSDVTCRYGNLDKNSRLYGIIIDLMNSKFNSNPRVYNTMLRSLIKLVNTGKYDDVCSTCSNETLIDAFRELAML